MIVRTYVVAGLACAGLALAGVTVNSAGKRVIPSDPIAPPATSPYASSVAGAGIIEASTENIEIGAHRAGVVAEVSVRKGQRVNAGDAIFRLDDRAARAGVEVRRAELEQARRSLERLLAMPRAEDLPPAEARVARAAILLEDQRGQLERLEAAGDAAAATPDELARRRFAASAAEAELQEARAELDLLRAGSWSQEVLVARAQVDAALAQLGEAEVELELMTVRAPVAGEILQLKVRQGEFASEGGQNGTPMAIMGETSTLHVRVDIDENDAWRVRPGSKARASLRGNSAISTDLTWVYAEPLVIPKQSLTGSSSERVDTRVLQAVYSFPRDSMPAYVGQLVDVYIEAAPPEGATPSG